APTKNLLLNFSLSLPNNQKLPLFGGQLFHPIAIFSPVALFPGFRHYLQQYSTPAFRRFRMFSSADHSEWAKWAVSAE
ncbi:hypothetical protein, partial [Faecalibaculum rodentium]|uniref:hypothetical protein n=1 Tax=Faecalibaculum rodentium TaxID=1702221 RepID=UPI0023F3E170